MKIPTFTALIAAGFLTGGSAFAQEQKRDQPVNEERKAARQELLKKYDANKDGKLDAEERKQITPEERKKAREAGMTAEQKKTRDELFQKYDTNKDGRLDKEERGKVSVDDLKRAREAGILPKCPGRGDKQK